MHCVIMAAELQPVGAAILSLRGHSVGQVNRGEH